MRKKKFDYQLGIPSKWNGTLYLDGLNVSK
jgi:hypothetical protein